MADKVYTPSATQVYGFLVIVRDEEGYGALTHLGVPVVRPGRPDGVRGEDVLGVPDLYLAGGGGWAAAVARRLRQLGYLGRAWELALPREWAPDAEARASQVQYQIRQARRLELPVAAEGNGKNGGRLENILRSQLATLESCTHDELLDADLPPLRYCVEGLVPDEGLCILGGKKKLGKSWLCLQKAQAVARGVPCLGRPTVQGPVTYVCLEDGRRRLRQRLEKQQTSRGLPITYITRHPPLDLEGLDRLAEYVDKARPRLLIIDTLAAAKTGKTDENSAGPMADLGNALRGLAQHFKLAVLATHHHGKGVGGDPGDDLRGSSALAAAADVSLGIYKEEGNYLLRGEGRDIEGFSLRVEFDFKSSWAWQFVGDAKDTLRDEAEGRVLAALRMFGEADADALAGHLEVSRQKVKERLEKLFAAGRVHARIAESGPKGGRPKAFYRLAVGDLADESAPDGGFETDDPFL
jgi:hypothetical protein